MSFTAKAIQSIAALYVAVVFGPSGVRALPLAAGINEGGHYFRLPPLFKTTEVVVVGFQIFAMAP